MKPILNINIPKFFQNDREYYMSYVRSIMENHELKKDYHIIVTQKSKIDVVDLEVLGLEDNKMSKRQRKLLCLKKLKLLKGEK